MEAICRIEGCERVVRSKGLCGGHYLRLLRHGDPLSGRTPPLAGNTVERLWPRVVQGATEECWPWTGAVTDGGYGILRGNDGLNVLAHRAAWQSEHGPVPDGLELDHLCSNRVCCNPAHLEPVTHAENMRRMLLRRTHCKHGHELNPENTRWADGGRRRICLSCDHSRQRAKYQRRKARAA